MNPASPLSPCRDVEDAFKCADSSCCAPADRACDHLEILASYARRLEEMVGGNAAFHQHDFCVPVWEQDPNLSPGPESTQRVAGYQCSCGVRRI